MLTFESLFLKIHITLSNSLNNYDLDYSHISLIKNFLLYLI